MRTRPSPGIALGACRSIPGTEGSNSLRSANESQVRGILSGSAQNCARVGAVEPTRLFELLTSAFEKTPSTATQELVRLFLGQHATSGEQNEKLAESARACVMRFAELANRIEERTLCGYQYCGQVYFRGRNKHAPGQKYCSRSCAQRAGEPLTWQGP
jgi:hypothetical protein